MIMAKRTDNEARAYCEVLEYIFAHYRDIPISEESICYLHEQLLKYSEKDAYHKGKYRDHPIRVHVKDRDGKIIKVWMEGVPAHQAPAAMRKLILWVNKALASEKYHPLIITSAFVSEFLKIHPFSDGNGRIERVLTNLLLLKAGYDFELYYPHEKIIEKDLDKHHTALSGSQKTFGTESESILSWTDYFLNLVLEQAKLAVTVQAIEDEA